MDRILVLISFQGQCDGDLEGTTVNSGEILGPFVSTVGGGEEWGCYCPDCSSCLAGSVWFVGIVSGHPTLWRKRILG